jgi:mRNA interferase RelE/StbE
MSYTIVIRPRAQRDIKKLPSEIQQKILKEISTLSDDPRPSGVKKLSGIENFYRIRIGNYRVIYSIQDEHLRILVVYVGHRGDVYEKVFS